jgi:DNA-binding MarR family transcriptional regulator
MSDLATAPATAAPLLDDVRHALSELLGAERRLRGRDRCVARDGEPTITQVRVLLRLAEHGEATAGQLARAADLTPASVTAMLDHLERDGVVQRRRSDADRRVVLVALTEQGRALVAAKSERWAAHWQDTLRDLSDEELRAAAAVMRRVAAMLDDV